MPTRLNRKAYKELIEQDIAALEILKGSAVRLNVKLELEHAIQCLRAMPELRYPAVCERQRRYVRWAQQIRYCVAHLLINQNTKTATTAQNMKAYQFDTQREQERRYQRWARQRMIRRYGPWLFWGAVAVGVGLYWLTRK